MPLKPFSAVGDHRQVQIVAPAFAYLGSYRRSTRTVVGANTFDPAAGALELERIRVDSDAFLAAQDDRDGGEPVRLPDGSVVPRLPGYRRWMWDGEFAGVISVRWQPGTVALPPHLLGHIGYAVVPWKRRRGHATSALRQLLPGIDELGLPYVELTTDEDDLTHRGSSPQTAGCWWNASPSQPRSAPTAQPFAGGSHWTTRLGR